MIQIPEVDETKLSTLIQLIEEINQLNYPAELEKQLQTLTGKTDICFQDVLNYWECSELEAFARSLLMPKPEKQNLSDFELAEIITAVCECRYSEPETDYLLKVLEKETGQTEISDLIFYPETDDISAIIGSILGKA